MINESAYQSKLIRKLKNIFPEIMILKNDPTELQGIPDLLLLNNSQWAMLEVKRSHQEPSQPNQQWYIDVLNNMSFAAYIYPENEEEVIDALQSTFGSEW